MKFFGRKTDQIPSDQTGTASAPVPVGMVSLIKQAAVSLEKSGASGEKAAVYLVLDHSGSMTRFYADGAVQKLAEEALGISRNLDDDGIVPVVYFESAAHRPQAVSLDNYQGWIQSTHVHVPWGSTDYAKAMGVVAKHYRRSGAADPALVLFQTDGGADDPAEVERLLRAHSNEPIFWFFIGFGDGAQYLDRLPQLSGRMFGNVGVFQCGSNPKGVPAGGLYESLSMEFSRMLGESRAAGVLK